MGKYLVAVTYQKHGTIKIEAKNDVDFYQKLQKFWQGETDKLPLADNARYVPGSYEVEGLEIQMELNHIGEE